VPPKVSKTMKINSNHSLLLLVVVAGIAATIPAAYAAEVEVKNAPGSSVPGCEDTNECFIPYEVTIAIGDTVMWVNDDTAAHTFTSGTPDETASVGAIFDSGLVLVDGSFSYTFDSEGTFDYFCMVHPWMAGVVIVGEAMGEEAGVIIEIESEPAAAGEVMTIEVKFEDMEGNYYDHVNYNIKATQDGQVVLDDQGVHDHDGVMEHTTMALPSTASGDNPVDVEIEFLGFGIDPPFSGPIGQMGETQVVPEFGTIAMMILGVSIISIIAVTARSKVIPRL